MKKQKDHNKNVFVGISSYRFTKSGAYIIHT